MSSISIRISENSVHELDKWANKFHLRRADYIRKAIELMNSKMEKLERRDRLERASLKVRDHSLQINKEFDEVEDATKN